MGLDEKTVKARIRGERERVLGNIAARGESKQQWWLSFADEDGFRGVVISYGDDFLEAVMQTNLHNCNPHGEVRGIPLAPEIVVPPNWTYRVLSKDECRGLEALLERG